MTSTGSGALAARLCRTWVKLYTRRLPSEFALRRRQEIESDLFEHRSEAADAGVSGHRLAAEVLGRVLVGVPADLTWRRATRQQLQPRLAIGGTPMSLSTITANRLLTVLGGLVIVYVWGLILGDAFFFPAAEDEIGLELVPFLIFGLPPLAASLAMAAGLKIRADRPRGGFRLIVAGAIGPVVWFWMLPIYAPLLIATIVVATMVTPRKKPAAWSGCTSARPGRPGPQCRPRRRRRPIGRASTGADRPWPIMTRWRRTSRLGRSCCGLRFPRSGHRSGDRPGQQRPGRPGHRRLGLQPVRRQRSERKLGS